MDSRDPFPMTSPEAAALEMSLRYHYNNNESSSDSGSYESDEDGCELVWTSMGTETEGRGPSDAAIARLRGGGESLTGKKKKKAQKTDDDAPAAVMDDVDDVEEDAEAVDAAEDEFLDRPVWESRAKGHSKMLLTMGRFGEKIVHRLYGDDLPIGEFLRTLCLASTLFFMIGGYWLMRSLKDPVLTALCGVSVIPKAKMLSVFVVLAVVSIYNKLLDSDIPKHKLFYVFGMFYFCFFTSISLLLTHPTIGLANEQPNPRRLLGWVSYCGIESFGSVMVSLFWSFANSNISLETAKASYGVMVATAQVGSIIGPTLVQIMAPKIGVARVYFMGAIAMLLLQSMMYNYIRIYGVQLPKGTSSAAAPASGKKKEKAGVLEGLHLFYKHNYVKGIFAISCLFMIEVTIVDFTMKVLARDYFATEYPCRVGMSCFNALTGEHGMSQEATNAFTAFMGFFGQATNMLSFTLSFFGTSAVIRTLGLRLTLLLFPSLCLAVIIFVRLHPTLYVVFGAMMMLKANSYALNNPTKEILYQPTSPAIKYKAKSWIDIFGARGSKALGSVVTNAFSDSAAKLVANGSLVGMMVASFLIWNATFMGRKFDEYTSTGFIVGETGEEDEDEKGIHMAINQNKDKDTSCAIYDDDEVGPEEEGQSDDSEEDNNEGEDDDAADGKAFAKKPEVSMV